MKILKTFPSTSNGVSEFVNKYDIPREDILAIVADGAIAGRCILFYYEEPKPEEKKKGFWG